MQSAACREEAENRGSIARWILLFMFQVLIQHHPMRLCGILLMIELVAQTNRYLGLYQYKNFVDEQVLMST